MKVLSIGTDRKLFEENSAVRLRQIEYGRLFERLDIVVFSKRNLQSPISEFQISNNVFIHPTNSSSKLFYVWDAFVVAKKLINNSRDIVISSQDPFETGFVGAFLKLFFNLPLHIQIHTDFAHKYFGQSSLLNKVRLFLAEFNLKYSDRVRVVSDRIKKSVEKFSKNIDVLPISQGLTLGNEDPKMRPLEIKKPFPFTLLMVCRLEKEKNIEIALQVVKNSDKNIGLYIVGDGSQKSNLEKIAKNLGISERVIFVGWKNNLAPYYKMADAFLSTSLYEGYGISTVEAAYFGKPLILSETGMAGDIFKADESAFVCDAKDSNCFTQSILKIYQDKNLAQKMSQSAKVAANRHLSSESNYTEKYADSIKKTTNNFKNRNFISRVFYFKKTVFNSFVILRYFICGITAAAANIGSLYIFTDIVGIWYLYSSVLAFFVSLFISFVLQKFVVFKDMKTGGVRSQFSKFFIIAILGVITNTALIFASVEFLGIWYILSQIIAGFFVMFQNFIFYKFFIFNK